VICCEFSQVSYWAVDMDLGIRREGARRGGDQAATQTGKRISQAQAMLFACLGLALLNATIFLSSPGAALSVRALLALFDTGHALAVGVVGYWLLRTLEARPRAALGVVLALAALAGFAWIAPDFANFSARHAHPGLRVPLGIASALSVPVAAVASRRCHTPALRLIALTAAAFVATANHFVLQADYPGIHLLLAWNALVVAAGALTGARPVNPLSWLLSALGPRRRVIVASALALPVSLLSLVVLPPTHVLVLAFRSEGSVLVPFLVSMHREQAPATPLSLPNDPRIAPEYFRSRAGLPELPPSSPSLVPADPVVVLLTIDAMRADLLEREEWRRRLPHFEELASEAVEFTRARSPGSTTRNSLGQLFASRYASELHWGKHGRFAHLVDEPTPRLTDRLRAAHFATLQLRVLSILARKHRLIGNFEQDKFLSRRPKGQPYPLSESMVNEALRLLARQAGPTFLYMHWLDAHDPYNAAGKEGSDFERYLREVELVDRSLGKLIDGLKKQGMWDRTVLVVSADHGEALGDHGIPHHGGGIYESLVRVPLLIRVPGVRARRVDTPVTTLDIAPTLLDLLGQPTPGEYMGQSLVGFLRGESPTLKRPIALDEGRLLIYGLLVGPYKVIEHRRRHTLEIYDLVRDPAEANNLYGSLPNGEDERLVSLLRSFFAVRDAKATVSDTEN
jgi:hypothetical protein